MKVNILYFTLAIFLFLTENITAQLNANVVLHDSDRPGQFDASCSGVLEVDALGNSGPFLVQVFLQMSDGDDRPTLVEQLELTSDQGSIIRGVCSGDYTIVYTNRFGCEFVRTATVNACGRDDCCEDFRLYTLGEILGEVPQVCSGNCNGALSVSTSMGGFDPLGREVSYQWSTGESGSTIRNLCSGTYSVTATDEFGCSATRSFEICCANIELSNINAASEGADNGSVTYEFFYDVPLTSIILDGRDVTNLYDPITGVITGLTPGTHSLRITTVNSCGFTMTFTINECDDSLVDTHEDVLVDAGLCPYEVNVAPVGFATLYSYQWSDGLTNSRRTLSCNQDYEVTITSNRGCGSYVKTFLVCEDADEINLSDRVTEATVAAVGASDGTVTFTLPEELRYYLSSISVLNSNLPLSFTESTFLGTVTINGLMGGDQTLVFSHESGCTKTASVFVPSCETTINEGDVILSDFISIGEFGNYTLTPVLLKADVELLGQAIAHPLIYQLVRIWPVFPSGSDYEVVRTNNKPEFLFSSTERLWSGDYAIYAVNECTDEIVATIRSFRRYERLIIDLRNPYVYLETSNFCQSPALTRAWYKVRGVQGSFARERFSVGDSVTVRREYDSDRGADHSEDYEDRVTGFDSSGALFEKGNDRHHIKHSDKPGILTITITPHDGTPPFISETTVGQRPATIPFVLGGGHDLSEGRLFENIAQDFWLGFVSNCKYCGFTNRFFDNNYWDNNPELCSNSNNNNDPVGLIAFRYEEDDIAIPCKGGGTLFLPSIFSGGTGGLVGEVEIPVSSSFGAFLVENEGGLCGCAFPPSSVDLSAIPARFRPDIGPYLMLYAEFDCAEDTTDGPEQVSFTEVEIDSLCQLYGASGQCDECDIWLGEDDCSEDLVCLDDGYILRSNIQRDLPGAYQGGACFIVLPDEDIFGLSDVFLGVPCEVFVCDAREWTWNEQFQDLTSVQVEQLRETDGFTECPNFGCDFSNSDIDFLFDPGGFEEYYYQEFEKGIDEDNTEFHLFPNPVEGNGGTIRFTVNKPNVKDWEVLDLYGRTISKGGDLNTKGQATTLSSRLQGNYVGVVVVRVYLNSGEFHSVKVVLK